MKIWLDDLRDAPDDSWAVFRTAQEAIDHLANCPVVECISLDHDLGEGLTGYDVAKWIEIHTVMHPNYFPPVIMVHSANPVGRANILAAVNSIGELIEKRWSTWGAVV